ncbi:MAG: putative bifunctional diguanylate cyclase/phosphodiesterase [Actinomycetota bacterium]
MRKDLDGRVKSPVDEAPRGTSILARRGWPTIARTLKLACVFVLVGFVAFMFASYLSVQSIDKSFSEVAEVDQPSLEAANEMSGAADEAMIAFLESLVTDQRVSLATAEVAFLHSMEDYQALIRDMSRDELSESATQLFGRLNNLGRGLVSADQRRQLTFIELQAGFEAMDDEVGRIPFLSHLEGDVEENARMVSNYSANPKAESKEEALEEFAEFFDELHETRKAADRPSELAAISSMEADVKEFEQSLLLIISLTEESAEILPRFLSISSELDEVLENGIYERARDSLSRRNDQAAGTVESSKLVLIASLAIGLFLGLGGLLWVRRRITHPVGRLMSQIARRGEADAANEADLGRRDEFGVLARALADAASQQAALEEELRRQALEDPLTGLANRTLFKDRVEHALKRRREDGKSIAVAFLDLDDFKTVNDSLGHAAGDELLVEIARRIEQSVRTSDTTARLGGDEFAVLLDDVEDVAVPAQRILQALEAPIQLEGKPVTVHGSVGIALYEPGLTAADLLRNADVAMYRAKAEGKGSFKAFDQTMQGAAAERFELKNELLSAIADDEFRLHYQPIMDLTTGSRVAVEALVRWEHPLRGMVGPGDFIPLAEETGAIVAIGSWVLDTACAQVAAWRRRPDSSELRLCVNVSPIQLGDPSLVADVSRALSRAGLPAQALVLEITESEDLPSDEALAATVGELARLGVVIALDDFGSGYSSLGYLSKLPIGILKIDRSFVDGIDEGPEEAAVAQAIIRLGETLGLEIIAEGIETLGQLAELRSRGAHLGQGFLLGRPAPPERSTPLVVAVA